ncbi:MAG: DUF192 domain-containing protein, partial [Candidatus Omnitrophota bacterium]|nr:DUF192 domain-containing protein [Candidatus Omnitrophota bacterium]
MQILNQTRNTTVAENAVMADTAFSRLKGLLGRSEIGSREALVITQCRSIHMFFMKFAIDVIFADRHDRAVGLVSRIKPFCMSPYFFRASYAVELPEGAIASSRTQKGDQLVFVK